MHTVVHYVGFVEQRMKFTDFYLVNILFFIVLIPVHNIYTVITFYGNFEILNKLFFLEN